MHPTYPTQPYPPHPGVPSPPTSRGAPLPPNAYNPNLQPTVQPGMQPGVLPGIPPGAYQPQPTYQPQPAYQPQAPYQPQQAYQPVPAYQSGPSYHDMYSQGAQPFPAAYTPGPVPSQSGAAMPGINPLNFMAAGGLLSGAQSWGQAYVERAQQRMGWLSGYWGFLNVYFNIDKTYVGQKLLMLFAPYLKRWTYTRVPEQIQGVQKYRPPRFDVNAPDLYLPIMGVWTYVILVCAHLAVQHQFKPDLMYHTLSTSLMGWLAHTILAGMLLRAMSLPSSISWVELLAFTGYSFIPVCASIVLAYLGGYWAYYLSWGYGSLCLAVFLVRAMKRIMLQELRQYGRDLHANNYLLLALALFQFPFALWLGVRPSHSIWHGALIKPA